MLYQYYRILRLYEIFLCCIDNLKCCQFYLSSPIRFNVIHTTGIPIPYVTGLAANRKILHFSLKAYNRVSAVIN